MRLAATVASASRLSDKCGVKSAEPQRYTKRGTNLLYTPSTLFRVAKWLASFLVVVENRVENVRSGSLFSLVRRRKFYGKITTSFMPINPSGDFAHDLRLVGRLKLLRNRVKRISLKVQIPAKVRRQWLRRYFGLPQYAH